jgi:hypothetical protein
MNSSLLLISNFTAQTIGYTYVYTIYRIALRGGTKKHLSPDGTECTTVSEAFSATTSL